MLLWRQEGQTYSSCPSPWLACLVSAPLHRVLTLANEHGSGWRHAFPLVYRSAQSKLADPLLPAVWHPWFLQPTFEVGARHLHWVFLMASASWTCSGALMRTALHL